MFSIKNSQQMQNEYPINKSKKYQPATAVSSIDTSDKISFENEQNAINQSKSRDSIGKNLTHRIKKAKNEIFLQNEEKKSKPSKKQSQKIATNMEIETPESNQILGINKGNKKIINNKEGQFNNNANQSSKQNYQIKNLNTLFNNSDFEINIFKDDYNDIQNQKDILQEQSGNFKEEFDNEQLQSDVNSNQIECSGSNRPYGGQDDSFMDDFLLQNNKQFKMKIPLIGENSDDESTSNKQTNQEGDKKDTGNQELQQQQQNKRRRKKKDSTSNSDKLNEDDNTQQKIKKGNTKKSNTEPKQKREYKRKGVWFIQFHYI